MLSCKRPQKLHNISIKMELDKRHNSWAFLDLSMNRNNSTQIAARIKGGHNKAYVSDLVLYCFPHIYWKEASLCVLDVFVHGDAFETA